MIRLSYLLLCVAVLAGCSSAETKAQKPPHFSETINAQTFYKGNLQEKGSAPQGYQFIASNRPLKSQTDFLVLKAQDLEVKTPSGAVHFKAICGKSQLVASQTLNSTIEAAHKDGAVSMIDHPNKAWSLNAEELTKADGFELLEIASGNVDHHDGGDDSHASVEEIWDQYMTAKHRVFGAASDDSSRLGAWIQAWAPELSTAAICDAIRNGHFYAARGTKLSALVVTPQKFEVAVNAWQGSEDHVDFIGAGGVLLERSFSNPARYNVKGGEGYVRAHVFQPRKEGLKHEAWTQSYYIRYD